MALTLEDIAALRSGWREPIHVGDFSDRVCAAMNLKVPAVYLSAYSLRHINDDHPDITDVDLLHLSSAVRRGLILRETVKPRFLIAAYQDPASHRRYAVVIKTVKGCESWIDTFHRAHMRQTRALLKRCEILAKHK